MQYHGAIGGIYRQRDAMALVEGVVSTTAPTSEGPGLLLLCP
jgi:hypothetical protein